MHDKENKLNLFKSKSCVLKNVITSNGSERNSPQLFRLIIVNFNRAAH